MLVAGCPNSITPYFLILRKNNFTAKCKELRDCSIFETPYFLVDIHAVCALFMRFAPYSFL